MSPASWYSVIPKKPSAGYIDHHERCNRFSTELVYKGGFWLGSLSPGSEYVFDGGLRRLFVFNAGPSIFDCFPGRGQWIGAIYFKRVYPTASSSRLGRGRIWKRGSRDGRDGRPWNSPRSATRDFICYLHLRV